MKILIHSLIKRLGYRLKNEPGDVIPAVGRFLGFATRRAMAKLTNRRAKVTGKYIAHFGVHMPRNNAGDTVLFDVVERLFDSQFGTFRWLLSPLRKRVQELDLNQINRSARAVLVGGGGLFMRNEDPHSPSGWQWNITADQVRRIKPPLILFAVGYNQFRGNEPFSDRFEEHLEATISKASFVGLRNSGSIAGLKSHLPEALHSKLEFQPCMTTVLKRFYPPANLSPMRGSRDIAINLAFDRRKLRFGNREDVILQDIAKVLRHAIALGYSLHATVHSWDDDPMADFLRKERISARVVRLNLTSPQKIVEFYARMPLTIGMRGHAQMIPFGCGNAIFSIISHNKVKYFLEDIGHPEWGVDVNEENFADPAMQFLDQFEASRERIMADVERAIEQNWHITQTNLENIRKSCGF